jgi:glutaredoxin
MRHPTVKLLVLTTCPQCKALRDLLTTLGIPFESTDVDTLAPEEQQELLLQMAPHNPKKAFPVTFINGKAIIGYQKDVLLEELGLKP